MHARGKRKREGKTTVNWGGPKHTYGAGCQKEGKISNTEEQRLKKLIEENRKNKEENQCIRCEQAKIRKENGFTTTNWGGPKTHLPRRMCKNEQHHI